MYKTLTKATISIFVCLIIFNVSAGMLITGKVNVGNLYVRVKPDTKFTKVATLRKDDSVVILEKQGNWYRILAPQNTEAWVPKTSVANNKISKTTFLYAGPGIGYSTMGTLQKDAAVKVVDSANKEWTKIAPPEGTTAWVASEFVDVSKEDIDRLEGKTVAVTVKETPDKPIEAVDSTIISDKDKKAKEAREKDKVAKAEEKDKTPAKVTDKKVAKSDIPTKPKTATEVDKTKATKPTAKPTAKTAKTEKKTPAVLPTEEDSEFNSNTIKVSLSYIPGSEQRVRRIGYVLPLINPVYVTNALGKADGKRVVPFCYIHCNGFSFDSIQNKASSVGVIGIERKVKGWKLPMIEVEKVFIGKKMIYQVPKAKVQK